jgi:hypothetical protein
VSEPAPTKLECAIRIGPDPLGFAEEMLPCIFEECGSRLHSAEHPEAYL